MYEIHTTLGEFLCKLSFPKTEVILDTACGGQGQIRLYGDDAQGERQCMTWVDAGIIYGGEIKVVLEMDYSDIRPNALCGKVLSTAISAYYKRGKRKVPLSDSMLFIQVVQHKTGDEQATKLRQCRYLESEINSLLRAARNRVACYSIHYGNPEDFGAEGNDRESLRAQLASFLKISESVR